LETGPRLPKLCSKLNAFNNAIFKFTKQGDRVLMGDLHTI
jgi:cystathionine beta-lyase/cystathionine gamma-synthase